MDAAQPTRKKNGITANAVASNLFKTSKIKPTKQMKININIEYKKELDNCEEQSALMNDFIRTL